MHLDTLRRAESDLAEALVDPEAWGRAIEGIAAGAGARGGVLLPLLGTAPKLIATDGVAEVTDAYLRGGWSERDGRSGGLPRLLRNGVLADPDVMPLDAMSRHPFWGDLLEPHGLWWSCGLVIRAGDDLWCLALQRTRQQGAFLPQEQAMLLGLSGALSRSATLLRQLGEARLDGFRDALDHTGTPSFVMDRHGRVVRSNALAEGLILAGCLAVRGGELVVPGRPDVASAIKLHVEATLWSSVAPRSRHLDGVAVPREGRAPLLVQAHLIRGALSAPFAPGRVLVLVTDPAEPDVPSRASLRVLFELTDSEARLVQALAAGADLPAAAIRMGVTYQTARSYLKSAFAKTETHHQGELVALAARLRS